MDYGKVKITFMNKNLKEQNFKIQNLFQILYFLGKKVQTIWEEHTQD